MFGFGFLALSGHQVLPRLSWLLFEWLIPHELPLLLYNKAGQPRLTKLPQTLGLGLKKMNHLCPQKRDEMMFICWGKDHFNLFFGGQTGCDARVLCEASLLGRRLLDQYLGRGPINSPHEDLED